MAARVAQGGSDAVDRGTVEPSSAVRIVPVDGMHCAACASKVERALRADGAVVSADVSFATRSARIRFDGARTDLSSLARRVRDAGFGLDLARDPAVRAQRELDELRALRLRVIVGIALSLPLAAIAMTHGSVPWLAGKGAAWAQFVLATPVFLWCGWPVHRATFARLRAFGTDMHTLVSLGTTVAFAASVGMLFTGDFSHAEHAPHFWFEAAAIILVFVLIGRLLEARATQRAGESMRALGALAVPTVRVVEILEGREHERAVGAEEIEPGMRVRIRPGERVPVDGTVIAGSSEIDESMLTGETLPIVRRAGDAVTAGTLNTVGALDVVATRTSADTVLARVVAMVDEAQATKARIARTADRVAAVFVPAILLVAFGTLAAWLVLAPSDWPAALRHERALEAFVSVLVVACPCALGLATPVAVMVASGRAAQRGVLFRTAAAFEKLASVRAVVLDKTGTITQGEPRVVRIVPTAGCDGATLLEAAACVESTSEHPVARGIVAHARELGIAIRAPEEFVAVPGEGVRGVVMVGGRRASVAVGRASWVHSTALAWSGSAIDVDGQASACVAIDGVLAGTIELEDSLRASAVTAVATLRKQGIEEWIASGDAAAPVARVGFELTIPTARVRHGMTPTSKAELVREIHARAPVAFVGDGINDAVALAAADAGIAMAGGTDVAKGSADLVLVFNDLAAIPAAISLSRATLRVIRQNLAWAFGYNAVLIPLAAGALFPWTGTLLPPVAASAAMALSSVTVVANSLRLRKA
jgi:Cu+-exporting ATPase